MKMDFANQKAVEHELWAYSAHENIYSMDTITLIQEVMSDRLINGLSLTPRIIKFYEDANRFQSEFNEEVMRHVFIRNQYYAGLLRRYSTGEVDKEIAQAAIGYLESRLKPIEDKYKRIMNLYIKGKKDVKDVLIPREEQGELEQAFRDAEKHYRKHPF